MSNERQVLSRIAAFHKQAQQFEKMKKKNLVSGKFISDIVCGCVRGLPPKFSVSFLKQM